MSFRDIFDETRRKIGGAIGNQVDNFRVGLNLKQPKNMSLSLAQDALKLQSARRVLGREGLGSAAGMREAGKGVLRAGVEATRAINQFNPTRLIAPKAYERNNNIMRGIETRLAPRGNEVQKSLNTGFNFSAKMAPYGAVENVAIGVGTKVLPRLAASKGGQFAIRRGADVLSGQMLATPEEIQGMGGGLKGRAKIAAMDIVGGTAMEGAGRVARPAIKAGGQKINLARSNAKMGVELPSRVKVGENAFTYNRGGKTIEVPNEVAEFYFKNNRMPRADEIVAKNYKYKGTTELRFQDGKFHGWDSDNDLFKAKLAQEAPSIGLSTKDISGKSDSLSNEARKYKSAEEFVRDARDGYLQGSSGPIEVQWGSAVPFKGEIPYTGLPTTVDPSIAKRFSNYHGGIGGTINKAWVKPNAKIIKFEELPNSFRSEEGMDAIEQASRWAKRNGYDGIDMRGTAKNPNPEAEIRIFNKDILEFDKNKLQSQLIDIWNKANKSQPLSPQSTQGATAEQIAAENFKKSFDATYNKGPARISVKTEGAKARELAQAQKANQIDDGLTARDFARMTDKELADYNASVLARKGISSTQGASKAKSLVRKSPQQAIETTTKLEQTPKRLQVSQEGVSPNPASSPKDVSFTDNISPKAENVNVDPVQKIVTALKEAKPLSQEQKALTSKLRSKQFAKMMSARGKTSGEKGFYSELGALKGGAKKVDFEAIRPNLEQKDIDGLFDRVNDANIGEWEKINAKASLAKLLSGEGVTIPTQNELKLLNDVFGNDFTKAILDKRSTWQKLMAGAGEVLNLPRSLMASFDLSAPLRQGVFLVGKPKQWVPAFFSMFKQFGSEKAYKAVQESIQARPTYKTMRQAKLAITDVGNIASGREEQFMSNLAEKIPVIGKGVRASGRAYTGFLNKLRADVFDDLYKKAKILGQDSPDMADDIAKFVNSATGRGDLGKLNNAATALNGVFFSPRLMASRVNLLNPVYYAQLNPMVRKEALKSLLTFGAVATSALGLAKLGGAEVGTDPRSADFGKIKVGDTRYDILGGFQQYLVLGSRLVTGKMVSSTTGKEISLTEGYKPTTRKDIIINFLQSKENPILSYLTNFAEGTTQLGQKFRPIPELIDRMIPMLAQDLVELADDKGWAKATGMTLPAFFGTGVQTYGKQVPNMNEKGKLEWRNPPSIGERIYNKATGQQASNVPEDQQKSLSDQRRIELQNKADVDTAKAKIIKNKAGSTQVGDKSIWWDEDNEEIKTGSKEDFDKYQFDKSGKKSELKNGIYYYRDKNGDPKSMTEGEYNTKVRKAKMDVAYNNKDYKGWIKLAEEELKEIENQYNEADPLTQQELLNDYQDLAAKIAKYSGYGGFTKGKSKKFTGITLSTTTVKIPVRQAKAPTFKNISSTPRIAIKTTKPKMISKSTLANMR